MPRKKLSEYRAKLIVTKALDLPYMGWSIHTEAPLGPQLAAIKTKSQSFVVKVDQGVKGRMKAGLVRLNVSKVGLKKAVAELTDRGFHWLIIEPMVRHQAASERYLNLRRTGDGVLLEYSRHGGIEIESKAKTLRQVLITERTDWQKLAHSTGLSQTQLQNLVEVFDSQHFVFLEINPYIVTDDGPRLLDLAVEVDDAGQFFVDQWSDADFRRSLGRTLTPEEQAVITLAEKSPASFKLDVINPDGAIFLLLSGGGASVVVADEIYNQGFGDRLANYGEYSGNPNTEETYLYAANVLSLLIKSKAKTKVLFIGGAVANFTDIANTFSGIIQAINEHASDLKNAKTTVFVRRGGPRQEIGLAKIEATLRSHGILGSVHSPETPLTVVVKKALEALA